MARISLRWLIAGMLLTGALIGVCVRHWRSQLEAYHVREATIGGYYVKGSWTQSRSGKFSLVYLYATPLGAGQAGCGAGTFRAPVPRRSGRFLGDAWIDGLYHGEKQLTKSGVPSVWVWDNAKNQPVMLGEKETLNAALGDPTALDVLSQTAIWKSLVKPKLEAETLVAWREEWKRDVPAEFIAQVPLESFLRKKKVQHNQVGADWDIGDDGTQQ